MAIIKFSNSLHDTIFSDFIHSTRCIEESYAGDCYKLRELDPESKSISLKNGWHSQWYGRDEPSKVERLNELMGGCYSYAKEFIEESFQYKDLKLGEWWVNIGGINSYNDIHMHGRATMIGIFFVQVPEGSGDLVIQRNDGSSYSLIYENSKTPNFFPIKPEVNRFYLLPGHLWHYVDFNTGAEDRISISVNYY